LLIEWYPLTEFTESTEIGLEEVRTEFVVSARPKWTRGEDEEGAIARALKASKFIALVF
jgi:hypothetical protein